MATPYGFLPGTYRHTKTGHDVEIVKLNGLTVNIIWRDTGCPAVILKKDLAFMPRKGGPPHGFNVGTYRVLGEDGPLIRVVQYSRLRFVRVDMGGVVFTINPAGLRPIGSDE